MLRTDPGYVEQVAAMEARAKKVGVPKTLKYLFPQNGGVNSSDAPKAKALGLGANLVCDLHTGPTGGVNSFQSMLHSNNTGADGWGKQPRYRCHLGCILLKTAAISLSTGAINLETVSAAA